MSFFSVPRRRLQFIHLLWLGFSIIIFLMLTITIIGVQRVNAIDRSLTTINDINSVKQRHAIDFRGSVHDRAIALRDVVMLTTTSKIQEQLGLIEKLKDDYERAEIELDAIFASGRNAVTPAGRDAYKAIKETAKNTRLAIDEVIKLRNKNQLSAAKLVLFEEASPGFTQWLDDINVFIDLQESLNATETDITRDLTGSFQATMIWLTGGAIIISLIIAAIPGRWLHKTLGSSPEKVRLRVNDIGAGDLRSSSENYPNNSIMHRLGEMTSGLADTVVQVRNASTEVADGSHKVSDICSELLGRVDKQASALTETASAMDELGSTVAHNAERAAEVDTQAKDAAKLATQSGHVVRKVEKAMSTLDTQSQEIVSIVELIDSIAFQTNILALNASVEAARAGEQGRGFAVVAQEVRKLATRSADASSQISNLIHQNLQQVGESVSLVNQASDKTRLAVESINRVTQLVAEISQASVEQSTAVHEVGQAVAEMDSVTQQNTDFVRHLSETGELLLHRSLQLDKAITKFDVDQPINALPKISDSWI